MQLINMDKRGDSFFTDIVLVAGDVFMHKQIEWRKGCWFVRVWKRPI